MSEDESLELDRADERAVACLHYLMEYCRGQGCDTCALGNRESCPCKGGGCPGEWRMEGWRMYHWCLNMAEQHGCKLCSEAASCKLEYRPIVKRLHELSQSNELLMAEKTVLEAEMELERVKQRQAVDGGRKPSEAEMLAYTE